MQALDDPRDELAAIKGLRWRARDEAIQRADALAARSLEPGLAAEVKVECCLLQLLSGQPQQAGDGLDAVLVDLDAQAHSRPWIHAMNLRASILLEQGERVRATTLFTAAWRLARDRALLRELNAVTANLAMTLEDLQAHEAADALLEDTLSQLEAQPELRAHCPHLAHQRVRVLWHLDPEASRALFDLWRDRLLASPRVGPAVLAITEAELLRRRGRAQEALVQLGSVDTSTLPPGQQLEAQVVRAECKAACGDLEGAARDLAASLEALGELSPHNLLPRARRALARVHEQRQQFAEASQLWKAEADYQRAHVAGQLGPAIERLGRRYLDEVDHLRLVELAEARDASERKGRLLEEAWHRAEAEAGARQRMLSEISHELRNPLHGLLGLVGRLEDGPDPATIRLLRRPTELMLSIVDDVLTLGRLEARELEPLPEPLHLASTLTQVLELASAPRPELALHLELDPRLPAHVLVDGRRLQQVLLNLLGNATKFARRSVRLSAELDGGLRLAVQDDGPGIPPEARERIFRPWEQQGPETQQIAGGSGLGLTIASRLARGLGGSLRLVDSERGARFELRLPLVAAPPPVVARPSSGLGDLRPPLSVLLVEDDEVARQVSTDLLRSLGVLVDSFEDGAQLLEIVEDIEVDLILIDLHLPGISGAEVARRLRQRGVQTWLVAHSASVMTEDHEEAREAGFDAFLPKPIRRAQLAAQLEEWLPRLRPQG
jgi:signal transduction histidine kinase/CheY-like chemotaxis protein